MEKSQGDEPLEVLVNVDKSHSGKVMGSEEEPSDAEVLLLVLCADIDTRDARPKSGAKRPKAKAKAKAAKRKPRCSHAVPSVSHAVAKAKAKPRRVPAAEAAAYPPGYQHLDDIHMWANELLAALTKHFQEIGMDDLHDLWKALQNKTAVLTTS